MPLGTYGDLFMAPINPSAILPVLVPPWALKAGQAREQGSCFVL